MEVRKPFNYRDHILPLVTNTNPTPLLAANAPLQPLQLDKTRPLEIKGPERLSNYEFLNELKGIQAEGMAER